MTTDTQPLVSKVTTHSDAQSDSYTRQNGLDYTDEERATLQQIANTVAAAIALDERANGVRQ